MWSIPKEKSTGAIGIREKTKFSFLAMSSFVGIWTSYASKTPPNCLIQEFKFTIQSSIVCKKATAHEFKIKSAMLLDVHKYNPPITTELAGTTKASMVKT